MPNRIIAIGDIHGCHIALENLLKQLEITSSDTVVVLGDVVDRGPGTKQSIEQLIELQKRCWLIFLQGNHEEMMLDAQEGGRIETAWLRYGGLETLESYGGDYSSIPHSHWRFLKSGQMYWETDSEIFVHANLEPRVPLEDQSAEWLRWTRLSGAEEPRNCGRRVICGHTNLEKGEPLVMDGWVCIDTWCYGKKCLTAIDVTHDLVYQAKYSGRTKKPVALSEFVFA